MKAKKRSRPGRRRERKHEALFRRAGLHHAAWATQLSIACADGSNSPRQLFRVAARPNQLGHLSPELVFGFIAWRFGVAT